MSYLAVIFIFVVNKKFYLVTPFGIFIMFITQKKKYLLVVMRILKDKIITEINGQRTTQHINATCRPQNSLLSSFNLEKSLCNTI